VVVNSIWMKAISITFIFPDPLIWTVQTAPTLQSIS